MSSQYGLYGQLYPNNPDQVEPYNPSNPGMTLPQQGTTFHYETSNTYYPINNNTPSQYGQRFQDAPSQVEPYDPSNPGMTLPPQGTTFPNNTYYPTNNNMPSQIGQRYQDGPSHVEPYNAYPTAVPPIHQGAAVWDKYANSATRTRVEGSKTPPLPYAPGPRNQGWGVTNTSNSKTNCAWVVLACLIKQAKGDTTGKRVTTQELRTEYGINHNDSDVDMEDYFEVIRKHLKKFELKVHDLGDGQVLSHRLLRKLKVREGQSFGACMSNGPGTSMTHSMICRYSRDFIHYTCYQHDSMAMLRNEQYEGEMCYYIWWLEKKNSIALFSRLAE